LKQDFDRQEIRKEFGFSENDFVIGKVARLFELKGHEYLFESFAELSRSYDNLKLFLIGNGIWREKFERIAEEKGFAEKIVFAGLVERSRIPEVIAASDMIAHCSLREGLARVLPQALLSEKPLVCFDVDGAREVVINDKTGYLIQPRDTAGLTAAIKDILENKERAGQFAAAGRELCRERFDWKVMAEKLYQLYKEGLENR
ncbi:MAG: glycosyltransferase family 4 protein, partial [Planctomycetota bacterium]